MKKDDNSESTTYCTETKKIHILDYLEQNGHQPVKVIYGSAWFHSPTRREKTPSFKVDLNKNLWYDFGIGEGGTLIDLVIKLNNYSVPEALADIGSRFRHISQAVVIFVTYFVIYKNITIFVT